jgi:outer membrane protein insertion porin family
VAASAVLLFSALAIAAFAAPQDYEGKPIQAIEFEPEKQPYSREYLDEILPVKRGRPLHLTEVRAAIERLQATGRYADIRVDAQMSGAGVILRFITRNNYFIGRVAVERIPAPPAEGVLVNATRLQLGAQYAPSDTGQAVNSLEELLRNNGFYKTHIEPEFRYDPDTQQVEIHFRVQTGERARYTTPLVTGTPGRPAASIIKETLWKGWFGWKPVTEARTQEGVQRVRRSLEKHDRLEARASIEKMDWDSATNRVRPSLDVVAGPRIRVVTEGAKVSQGKLRQLVPVFEEQSVDRDLLVEGANNLRQYLESQGYFNVKVDFASKSGANGAETIEYNINRGERHTVALVSIRGNHYFNTQTIRERMYVRPASFLQFRHGRFSDDFLRQDADAITALYRSNGFRNVEVSTRVENGYQGKSTNLAVYITIHEGPQWLVEKLDLEGVAEADREAVMNRLQSQPGQPFSEANVAIDRDNLLDYYHNRGYSSASFSWSFTPAGRDRANVRYAVVEGPQRFLREFLASGLVTTNPRLIEARETLSPGDPLSRTALLETQRRLYDLGIFSRVDMAIQNPRGEEREKYVLLDLEEARKYTFTFGFGAEVAKIGGCQSCLDAPAGQAGFSPRASFGVTRRNVWGAGHIVTLQSRVSTLEERAVLSYEAPQFRGNSKLNLLFSGLFDDSRDVRTFSARRREASVQIGEKLTRASTLLAGFSFRRVSVTDLKVSPELIPRFSQPARIGMWTTNYILDRRDDPTDPHRGIYTTLDLGWASHTFASQADFTRLIGQNATYHRIGASGRFVLARSVTFGWLQPLKNGTQIPLPEELYGGGASSHRGFPENQAGPRDLKTGFPLGGNALLVAQTELRFPLLGSNIGGVLFEDLGNVYSDVRNISFRVHQKSISDFDYMVHAVGFGIRYRTPVGPVRLDLAYSINPPRFFGFAGTLNQLVACSNPTAPPANCVQTVQRISHFQFHFSLGQAF